MNTVTLKKADGTLWVAELDDDAPGLPGAVIFALIAYVRGNEGFYHELPSAHVNAIHGYESYYAPMVTEEGTTETNG